MAVSDKLYKIIKKINGDFDDKIWDEKEMKYIEKDAILLKPSTKFFVTIINIVQIITRSISFFSEKNYGALIAVAVCLLSVLLMHCKLEKKFEKLNGKISIPMLREAGSFTLFLISILMIII